jgi:glycosyltransferase involved in cell wall biosynthesis
MHRARRTWALITGEYPPQLGGVADYTRLLAHALARDGDDVRVYAPPCDAADVPEPGVRVHRLPDTYGPRSRRLLASALADLPSPRAAVLQYVPQSFGMRGCNIPFARSLRRLSGYPLFVMFHEVSINVNADAALKYRVQAWATKAMAASAIGAADALFVSTSTWEPLIRRTGRPHAAIEWTPVPSNIALTSRPADAAAARQRFASAGDILLGHFGTYREAFSRDALAGLVPRLVSSGRAMLFLGRGSTRFVESLNAHSPLLRGRIFATGGLSAQDLADHLAACDLLVQPFADGVSTRRGSVTAALALGVPIATTNGSATEAIWTESRAVGLARAELRDELVELVDGLVADASKRDDLGRAGRKLYAERFAIEHTASALCRRASNGALAAVGAAS